MSTSTPMTPSPAVQFRFAPLACLALAASLAACGGGGGDEAAGPSPADRFTIGGTVSGLAATGAGGSSAGSNKLMLQNNEVDDLRLTANGRFAFATPLATGSAYAVRTQSQPTGQTCTVTQGSGAVAGSAVESVQVACAPAVWGLPEGAWVRDACGPATLAGQSTRNLFRLTRQDETHVTITQGTMVYANTQCTGGGTVQSEKEYARFVVDRKETRGAITAWWGDWAYSVSSDRPTRGVFARSGPYLCWGADHFWAQFPTMDNVENLVNNLASTGLCYQPVD